MGMLQARAEAGESASDRHDRARAWAEHWSQAWFLDPNGGDRLRIGDTDGGWATHAESYYVLERFAMERLGIARPTPSVASRLKARGHDRLIRAAAAQLTGLRAVAPRPADVACILEIPTPSMTDGVLAVARSLGTAASVLAADPRATRRAQRAGIPATMIRIAPATQLRLLRRASRELENALAGLREHPPRMELHGEDVGRAAVASLRPLVRNSVPWLAPEREAVERALDHVAPHSIVLASDQHRIGRLVCAIARRERARTIVVQHGLPQQRVGLVPVVADVVATWSEASRAWFLGQGTEPARLAITGNPRWRSPRRDRDAAPMVLLALSPAAVDVNRRVVELAVEAVRALGDGTTLVVKLHPGHRDWGGVVDVAGSAPARIAVREPIEPLLAQATAALVLRSTVAMDALAAECPVVLLRVPGGLSGADAELREAELPVAETPGALADAIRSVAGEERRVTYFVERARTIEHFLGPRDAAGRIAALALGAPYG